MKKLSGVLLALLLAAEAAHAQYTKLPEIPATVFNVKEYGAVGDNKTLNTLVIQKALDQAKAGGARSSQGGSRVCRCTLVGFHSCYKMPTF